MKKKSLLFAILAEIVVLVGYYYFALPPINPSSFEFWGFVIFGMIMFIIFIGMFSFGPQSTVFMSSRRTKDALPKIIAIPLVLVSIIVAGIAIVDLVCSPLFNASSYAKRITIDQTGNFTEDIEEVDFKSLPLLDKSSSQKLGDRVMGQMSEFVSQYYVSDLYTQINYNNDIIRVTPLEYADIIKWFSNRDDGVKGYISVNSVNGDTNLIKLDKGMKYMPSAFFNENLKRQLRFKYPTAIFGEATFEVDNDGNPFWIVPTFAYTGVNLKTRVTGVIIFNPITGESKKYAIKDVPSWVDIAYNAQLLIEQIDDWGTYNSGFFNSIFGQKNVVNTTSGYNYLAMKDDIYLYTGITSVLADESNLGFVLSNMRTGETVFYSSPGAEEQSAMNSAKGQVQQMSYDSTFPLLINLNNKATYLVSLKDAAGLVKMYGFVDVADYQKVVVTDASKGIEEAAQNYLNSYAEEISESIIEKKEITVKRISTATMNGNTYYYISDDHNKKYKVSITLGDRLPFISVGDKLSIGYYESDADIIDIVKLY